jgi:formate hydrogenlyase subunit 4
MIILVFLSNHAIDNILLNIIVVIVAAAFLFDLWTIADFKETPFSMSQLESMVLEDNKEEYGRNDV